MSAFAQTATGDLDLSSGNLAVSQDVAQNTAWKLSNLFGFFKGEWFRDTRLGFPAIQYVFVKNPNLNVIQQIFNKILLMPPGVASVQAIDLDYVANARTLSADFTVSVVDGSTIFGGLAKPFIVQDAPE